MTCTASQPLPLGSGDNRMILILGTSNRQGSWIHLMPDNPDSFWRERAGAEVRGGKVATSNTDSNPLQVDDKFGVSRQVDHLSDRWPLTARFLIGLEHTKMAGVLGIGRPYGDV